MKQMFLTFAALVIISSIAYYTLTHSNHGEVERLKGEHAQLEKRNDALRNKTNALEQQVVALRDDPRLAERRARQAGGLAKPHELIYQFEDASKRDVAVEVKLKISPRKLELAGKQVATADLPAALEQLATQVPNAHLEVSYDEALGPIARQRIQDILAASPLAETHSIAAP